MACHALRKYSGLILLLAVLVLVRIVALDADTLPSLDWTSGIWTDEGFYTYHARNAVLFGRGNLDEFHNELLSPVLDWVQRGVFENFGVGLVSARAISVACSLFALAFFFDALRRTVGPRIAFTALFFLGGDVVFVFYNRLALLETPSVLVLCAALWALTLKRPWAWVLAGALAASAIAFKTTFLVFLPVPLLVRGGHREKVWYAAGIFTGFGLYLALWGLPHGVEVWRMNNYYRVHQSQPRSVGEAFACAGHALFAPRRVLFAFLETRTPVLTTLALFGLAGAHWKRRHGDMERMLWLWAVLGLASLCFTRYAPTRYFLLIYPPFAGLAAIALWRLPAFWRWMRRRRNQVWRLAAPLCLLVYHTFGLALPVIACFALVLRRRPHLRLLATGTLVLFLIGSLGQWGFWYATRGYRTRDAARELAQIVKPGERLAGDWGPNLCLDNKVRAIPVFPTFANGRAPMQMLQPDYVVVAQTPYPVAYWKQEAPEVMRPENAVRRVPFHNYLLILYRVPKDRPTMKFMKPILRLLLSALMIMAGVSHFRNPNPFVKIVPEFLPNPKVLVAISGFFEILGGAGLLVPRVRRPAAWGLIALFVAVFPANVNMAVHKMPLFGISSPLLLWLRLPLQAVLIAWAYSFTRPDPSTKEDS